MMRKMMLFMREVMLVTKIMIMIILLVGLDLRRDSDVMT